MTKERNFTKSISIRADDKMSNMIDELEEKLLLNTTSIMKLALVTLYEQQLGAISSNTKGDD